MYCYEHGGDVYGTDGVRLDFSVNLNPLGLPPSVSAALAADEACRSAYPDPHCRRLRQKLAAHHSLTPEQVLCGNGAADLIFRIMAAFRPKTLLVTAPTFSEYQRAAALFGGKIIPCPLREADGFQLTEAILPMLEEVRPEMVFLCTPNNPTGRLIPRSLLSAIADRCRELGGLLVVDACFLPFSGEASLTPLLADYPNVLLLHAFTKLYAMAGLRLGYLLGAPQHLQKIAPFAGEWSVSGPAQTAGLAALAAEPAWSSQTRVLVTQEREFLTGSLQKLGIEVFPSDANFLLLRHARPLHRLLLEQGILTRSCANFNGLDANFIRIGIKTRTENQMLLQTIGEII